MRRIPRDHREPHVSLEAENDGSVVYHGAEADRTGRHLSRAEGHAAHARRVEQVDHEREDVVDRTPDGDGRLDLMAAHEPQPPTGGAPSTAGRMLPKKLPVTPPNTPMSRIWRPDASGLARVQQVFATPLAKRTPPVARTNPSSVIELPLARADSGNGT